jgi:tetratricopeptide (TPR) repeat protein
VPEVSSSAEKASITKKRSTQSPWVTVILLLLLSAAVLMLKTISWMPAAFLLVAFSICYLRPFRQLYLYGVEASVEAFPSFYTARLERLLVTFNFCARRKYISCSSLVLAQHVQLTAKTYFARSEFKKAESILRQAIECFGEPIGVDQKRTLARLLDLQSTALRLLGRAAEAESRDERSKLLRSECLPAIVQHGQPIGSTQWKVRLEAEERERLSILECLETNWKQTDPELALYLHSLANWYATVSAEGGREAASYRRRARPYYERAMSILEQNENIAIEELSFLLHDYAYYSLQQRSFMLARSLCERLLPLLEIRLGPVNGFVAAVLSNYSVALRQTGARRLATSVEKRAKAIWSEIGDRSGWGAREVSQDWALY